MAHQLIESPWIIDSAANSANYSITDKRVKVSGIEWLEPTTDDHECVLLSEDNNNSVVWAAKASANTNVGCYTAPGWVKGLYLRKLESGKLAIYFE